MNRKNRLKTLLEIADSARYGAPQPGLPPAQRQAADGRQQAEIEQMTDSVVPHFHNDLGVAVIEIGAKEFMCEGAKSPFDHPHVYCDMGDDAEHICPYCSTLYRHDPKLAPNQARPAECAITEPV
jgi:uncharacterized Zn-finger protein